MSFLRTSLRLKHTFPKVGASLIDISEEVLAALNENKPVVALESTIITHGMPSPHNLNTAVAVEEIVRNQDAVPATVAVIEGRIKVGLNQEQLIYLADPRTPTVKISRRDYPFVLSQKLNGGTTVSGTILVSKAVGINVFVTGGIGGVHRNGENTLDISADLNELGRNCIMTVCSGVKSILDIERTLEYLETQGVCVACYGDSRSFPAFYSKDSAYTAPYHVKNPHEAAKLLNAALNFNMSSGVLLAVPVPKEFSIEYDKMEEHIQLALRKAQKEHKFGKDVTPFLLQELANITGGKSLETNMALIKNNALVGGKIAKELCNLYLPKKPISASSVRKYPVVIGGSNLDSIINLNEEIKMDGRTVGGRIRQSAGGVGRNIADALGKLQRCPPLLLSAVGPDLYGQFLMGNINHLNRSAVETKEGKRTACYTTLIDQDGETRFGVGDMEIHNSIDKEQVNRYKKDIENASILIMDGNIPQETINAALEIASNSNLPVWFEPTDLSKACKPLETNLWKCITIMTPNLAELKEMARYFGLNFNEEFNLDNTERLLQQIKFLVTPLVMEIPIVMVTMGKHGMLMVSCLTTDEPVLNGFTKKISECHFRYYPPIKISNVQNTSGAGDCTASGFIAGALSGLTEPECVELGLKAGLDSLQSNNPVPERFRVSLEQKYAIISPILIHNP